MLKLLLADKRILKKSFSMENLRTLDTTVLRLKVFENFDSIIPEFSILPVFHG